MREKELLEQEIKSLSSAFELGFADRYTSDTGFNTDGFYEMLGQRLETLEQAERDRQMQEAIQQAQTQALQQAASASTSSNQAPPADTTMGS